jgi:hypothetical protein
MAGVSAMTRRSVGLGVALSDVMFGLSRPRECRLRLASRRPRRGLLSLTALRSSYWVGHYRDYRYTGV